VGKIFITCRRVLCPTVGNFEGSVVLMVVGIMAEEAIMEVGGMVAEAAIMAAEAVIMAADTAEAGGGLVSAMDRGIGMLHMEDISSV
jgi:hypothetical protein